MISIAWGNFLALVIPGAVILFALRARLGPITAFINHPDQLTTTTAIFLLFLAVLSGTIADALRRATMDRALGKWKPGPNIYEYVTPENLDVFRDAVENSYKYYAFYAHLLIAIALLILVDGYDGTYNRFDAAYALVVIVLARAGFIQYGAFSNRMQCFVNVETIRRKDAAAQAEKRG